MLVNHSERGSGSISDALADRISLRQFEPSSKRLYSTFKLLRSYQLVLQTNVLMAHLLGVPLSSDVQADKLGNFFSTAQPQVVEAAETETVHVTWAEIARNPVYDPVPQDDGSYQLSLRESKVLVKLSKFDHDMMTTTIPSQMVDPRSYPGDVSIECDATQLAMDQIARWKDTITQLSETVEDVLLRLSGRLQALQGQNTVSHSQDASRQGSTDINTAPVASSQSAGYSHSTTTKKRKAKGRGVVWSDDEANNLEDWFKQNSGLSQKELEDKYYLDNGIRRTYASLQAKLYSLDLGHLSHKRRKPSSADNARETRRVLSTSSEESTVDPAQFSLAIRRIVGAWKSMKSDGLNDEVESSSSCFEDGQGNMMDPENRFHPSLNTVGDDIDLQSWSHSSHSGAGISRQSPGFATDTSSPIQSDQLELSKEQNATTLIVEDSHGLSERPEVSELFGAPVPSVEPSLSKTLPRPHSSTHAPIRSLPSISSLFRISDGANGQPFTDAQPVEDGLTSAGLPPILDSLAINMGAEERMLSLPENSHTVHHAASHSSPSRPVADAVRPNPTISTGGYHSKNSGFAATPSRGFSLPDSHAREQSAFCCEKFFKTEWSLRRHRRRYHDSDS